MGILNELKCYFPKKILLQHYHALIYPHLFYAIPIWGSTYKSYLHKISMLQNKAVRIGYPYKMNSRANPSYTNLKVLKLNKLYQNEAGKTMYNFYHQQHLCNLNQYFTKSEVRHSRPTCSSTSLMLAIPFMKVQSCNNLFYTKVLKPVTLLPRTSKFPASLCLNLILSNPFQQYLTRFFTRIVSSHLS